MTWEVEKIEYEYMDMFTDTGDGIERVDCGYIVTNGFLEFETDCKEDAEWLCTTLDDYDTLKKKLDSLSRSVLCDNYGEC